MRENLAKSVVVEVWMPLLPPLGCGGEQRKLRVPTKKLPLSELRLGRISKNAAGLERPSSYPVPPMTSNGTSLVIRKLSMGPTFYAPRVGATGPRMKG